MHAENHCVLQVKDFSGSTLRLNLTVRLFFNKCFFQSQKTHCGVFSLAYRVLSHRNSSPTRHVFIQ